MGRDLTGTRAFFGPRAAGWDDKFSDDGPAYARAVEELSPPVGSVVLDVGCGTGRALPYLRAAVGRSGTVVGVDATPEMLAAGCVRGRHLDGCLVQADAGALPVRPAAADAVFAAGLLPHLADPEAGLRELARVCRRDGRLAIFHPVGRVSLAARHGSVPTDDDLLPRPGSRACSTPPDGSSWPETTPTTGTSRWPPGRADRPATRQG